MKYNPNTCATEMSVRSLCTLSAKHGDLDYRRTSDKQALLRGADIHRKLQAEADGYYSPEVPLTNTTLYEGMYYTVSGRADGVIRRKNSLCVDEIKCVRGHSFFTPPQKHHKAQLVCYAYMLAVRDGLESIDGRITYYNIDNGRIKYFEYTFTLSELKESYEELLREVSFFASLSAKRTLDTMPAAKNAVFPYRGMREGQEMMIRECFGAIKRGQRLFLEAPTGTGKTISSLFPSVRALGHGYADKIFYLTAKASTRREAYAGASKLFSSGIEIRAVVLAAKESMCVCPNKKTGVHTNCDGEHCPYAKGYYNRVNDALRELLSSSNGYPTRLIQSTALKYQICPHELSLDLSEYCDIVICDYNYAFDPSVYLRRYFGDEGKRERYVFLIDEAHNLSDRARDMYSATLRLSDFSISDECEACIYTLDMQNAFSKLRLLCKDSITKDADGNERGFFMSREPLQSFACELDEFRKKSEQWLKRNTDNEYYDAFYEIYSRVRKYLCVSDYFDKGFLCYVQIESGDIEVKVFCLDPSRVMNKLLERAVSSVLFSATLAPAEYFCNVLGCRDRAVSVSLPSVFPTENLCVAVADYISVRHGDRNANIGAFVSVIAATVSARHGNYIVYFPSYDCLQKTHKIFERKYPRVCTVVQQRSMSYKEKEEFLSAFKNDEGKLRVGFCVLGGAFSEGVDLPGSRLIGTVIFGVGLPMLSNERNIIRDYFDEDEGKGYEYAYTYPGMNNVLQAAGRVIRNESDRGIVVLVDDRYATPTYTRLLPSHWKNIQFAGNASSLAEISRRFWKNGDKN